LREGAQLGRFAEVRMELTKKLPARPEAVNFNKENKTARLFFPEESIAPTGDYYLRGGIAWPTMTDDGVSGYGRYGG